MDAFCTLDYITPQMAWLLSGKTKGVWEIRSYQDEPQIRVFGFFAMKDLFVALDYEYRFNLGDSESAAWRFHMQRAATKWKSLFPTYTPRTSKVAHNVFSGALDEKYFKD